MKYFIFGDDGVDEWRDRLLWERRKRDTTLNSLEKEEIELNLFIYYLFVI